MEGLLEGFRVLDICDERGLLCGRMLADLGADVIRIEPPGGSDLRRRGAHLGAKVDVAGRVNQVHQGAWRGGSGISSGTVGRP